MINDQFFVHLFTFSVSQPHFVETSQSTADNYLSFEKNPRPSYWTTYFRITFRSCQRRNFIAIWQLARRGYDIMSVFKLAAPVAQYYFRFCIWWRHSRRSKFICKPNFLGWVITTSGLKKQTSAILEFFQRLRCRSDYSKLCAIVHQAPNFPPNRTIRDGVITSYTTSRWQPGGALLLYFRFRIYMTQTLLFWRWNLCHPPAPERLRDSVTEVLQLLVLKFGMVYRLHSGLGVWPF